MRHIDLNLIPGLAPPPGVTSNFQHPAEINRQRTGYIMPSIGLTLSTVAVILRVYTKHKVLRSMHLEEYILILSQLGFCVFIPILVSIIRLGEGLHQWNVPMAHVMRIFNLTNVAEMLYFPIILGAKVAMLLQMKRMFIVVKEGILFWIYEILLWANIACNTAFFLTMAFACVPREKLWNPHVPGHCISTSGSLIVSSVLNVISDFTMLILPLVVIFQLHLPVRTKARLCAMFGASTLALMSSIIRVVYSVILTKTEDVTWAMEPTGRWAVAEITTVILVGSVPLVPGLVKYARGQDSSTSPSQELSKSSSMSKSRFNWGRKHSKSNDPSLPSFVDPNYIHCKDDIQVNISSLKDIREDAELGITKTDLVEK